MEIAVIDEDSDDIRWVDIDLEMSEEEKERLLSNWTSKSRALVKALIEMKEEERKKASRRTKRSLKAFDDETGADGRTELALPRTQPTSRSGKGNRRQQRSKRKLHRTHRERGKQNPRSHHDGRSIDH